MYLQQNNLVLRSAGPDDAQLLCRWWNDGSIMAHAGFPHGLGTRAAAIAASLEQDNDQNRRLILEVDGIPCGEMNYRIQDKTTAEIGIKICHRERQNRGLGTRALKLLISSLFQDFGCETIKLDTNLENVRAQHVYEKLGFRKARVNYNSWRDQLGRLQSSVDYELTTADFFAAGGDHG